jgi:hypothetical protein
MSVHLKCSVNAKSFVFLGTGYHLDDGWSIDGVFGSLNFWGCVYQGCRREQLPSNRIEQRPLMGVVQQHMSALSGWLQIGTGSECQVANRVNW